MSSGGRPRQPFCPTCRKEGINKLKRAGYSYCEEHQKAVNSKSQQNQRLQRKMADHLGENYEPPADMEPYFAPKVKPKEDATLTVLASIIDPIQRVMDRMCREFIESNASVMEIPIRDALDRMMEREGRKKLDEEVPLEERTMTYLEIAEKLKPLGIRITSSGQFLDWRTQAQPDPEDTTPVEEDEVFDMPDDWRARGRLGPPA